MIIFTLFFCINCFAQEKAVAPKPEQPKAEVRTIYEYQEELGLANKQVDDLKKILGDFQAYFTEKKKTLAALQEELGEMIKNKEDLKKIRIQLEKIAAIQVDASYFDIETSRKVEGVLTPKQLAKWKNIQADFQKKFQERMKEAQAKR
jgi:Spy/CpxP family protein refolding chaperone